MILVRIVEKKTLFPQTKKYIQNKGTRKIKVLRGKKSHNKQGEQGFVLIVGLVISTFLLLLAVPFMLKVSVERSLGKKSLDTLSALSLAEAGIERAIWAMNEQKVSTWSGDNDLRTMTISDIEASGGIKMGDIEISIIDPGGENPFIEASGSVVFGSQTITRTVRVGLQYNYPILAPENAISFYGSPTKHAKVKIFDHEGSVSREIFS